MSNQFPISKEELYKRTLKVLGDSKLLEVEQRGKTLVMLCENPQGNFVIRMTFSVPVRRKRVFIASRTERSDIPLGNKTKLSHLGGSPSSLHLI